MSYQAGDLKVVVPCPHKKDENGWGCAGFLCDDPPMDSRGDYGRAGSGSVYLPHSCDQWVIGGSEEIKALITDLLAALEYFK